VIGGVWIACGLAAFFGLSVSWKLVPAVVFVGIGLLFLRGAFTTVARHEERYRRDRRSPGE